MNNKTAHDDDDDDDNGGGFLIVGANCKLIHWTMTTSTLNELTEKTNNAPQRQRRQFFNPTRQMEIRRISIDVTQSK